MTVKSHEDTIQKIGSLIKISKNTQQLLKLT